MEKKWQDLSSDEKREDLFQRWLSPADVESVTPEAEKSYRERVTRIKHAIQLKIPDRVPVVPNVGFFPAYYSEITPMDVMYDYGKLVKAWGKCILDFEPDAHSGAATAGPGKLFEILDYKLYAWPGHGVSPDYSYQCLEGEYMKADEYDSLIRDPSHFFTTTYFTRIFGALEALKKLAPPTNVLELHGAATNFIPYSMDGVETAYRTLFEAGAEASKWMKSVVDFSRDMAATGFPSFWSGVAKAPFDAIGDTLRGAKGVMLDMYRQPDKLLQALEVMTPLVIRMGASAARNIGRPIVFMPLHKGADDFLSDSQFKRFYWPTFRKVIVGLVDEGCVPFCWAQGAYNSRLDIIRDLPQGKTIWGFDQTDMAKAKERLGDVACIGGNMPSALLTVGTANEVDDYTKKLIDTCGKGGGYVMMSGAAIDKAKPENVRAWIETTKEYGVYK